MYKPYGPVNTDDVPLGVNSEQITVVHNEQDTSQHTAQNKLDEESKYVTIDDISTIVQLIEGQLKIYPETSEV